MRSKFVKVEMSNFKIRRREEMNRRMDGEERGICKEGKKRNEKDNHKEWKEW